MRRTSILIVEDEQITALDIASSLERAGYVVAGRVDRGEVAIQEAQELQPDIVVMDIGLKGRMDGIEAAVQIRARFNIPVIFLTAYSTPVTLERARVAEPFGYILKPFDERELISNIEIALYKHNMENKLRDSEARFRGIFENSIDGFVLLDAQGHLTKWNAAAEQITGWQRAEVLGQPLWEVIFRMLPAESRIPLVQEALINQWRTMVQSGYANGLDKMSEVEIETPQGARRVVQSNGFAFETCEGMQGGAIFRDITESQLVGQALRQANDIVKNIQIGLHIYHLEDLADDRTLRMVAANPAAEKITGIPTEYVLGKTLDENFPELRSRGIPQKYAQVVRTQQANKLEDMFYEDDRIMCSYFSIKAFPLPNQHVGVSFENIIERKLAEEKLQTSEARLRALVENLPDIVLEINRQGEILFTTYHPDWYIGRNIRETLSVDQHERALEALEQSFRDGQSRAVELRTLTKEGLLTWDYIRIGPVKKGAEVASMTIIMTDITERKRAESELLRLSQAVEQSANVIVITDLDGQIEYVNPKFTEITGYSLAEALGKKPNILRSGEHPPEFYQQLWQTIKAGKIWRGEFKNRRKDGSLYWEDAAIAPVFDSVGDIVNFIAVKEDITARKALEAAERDQRQLAEALRATALILNRSLELDDVLDRVLANVGQLVSYDASMVLLIAGHTVRKIRYHSNEAHAATTQPMLGDTQANLINVPILQEMRQTRRPCIISDTRADPRWRAISGLAWVRSFISAPIEIRDEVAGLINLVSAAPNFFTPIHAERLLSFASQAAIAIENAQLYEQAHLLAITDQLTEIGNRRYFFDVARVEFERQRRYGGTLSVLLMDIDHFKLINDTHGHAVGDLALREIAQRIKNCVRTVDIVARYGGEEFVVLMPETGLTEACQAAERVRHGVGDIPFENGTLTFSVSLSLGVAEIDASVKDLDVLLLRADQALYAAKEAGRNCVRRYENSQGF